jgi:hypothetical protein
MYRCKVERLKKKLPEMNKRNLFYAARHYATLNLQTFPKRSMPRANHTIYQQYQWSGLVLYNAVYFDRILYN